MYFRTCMFSISLILALVNCTVEARDASLAELREYLKNTTDFNCWCEECKSINDTHLNYYVWFECETLMEDMLLKLDNDDLYYGHIMHSIRELMFDEKDFCEDETTTTSTKVVDHNTDAPNSSSPEKNYIFTDKLNAESCIQPKHFGNQHYRIAKAESNQFYWIVPVIFFVLLVNLIGGIYFYFRFAKIETYHRHVERNKEVSMPLE